MARKLVGAYASGWAEPRGLSLCLSPRQRVFGVWASLAAVLLAGALLTFGSIRSGVPVAPHATSTKSWSSVPLAARGPISEALGARDPAYAVKAAGGAGFAASVASQKLHASYSPSGVRVRDDSGAVVGMRLAGLGRGNALSAVSATTPRAQGNRVTYAHRGVSEWYATGPLGVEQGFDVAQRPAGAAGAVTLSLGLSGNARPKLAADGQSVTFARKGGTPLAYRGLTTNDARGRTLPSHLSLTDGRLLIHVDDRGAQYPLHVDPFVQTATLTSSPQVAGASFGYSVAVSADGSTVVVGAYSEPSGSYATVGAAYVFTKPVGGWATGTQTAKLTASDADQAYSLGTSIAVSADGSTVAVGAQGATVGSSLTVGAVYVYTRPAGGWADATQTAKLTGSDAVLGSTLGISVGISADGTTVVAGADGPSSRPGAAYVFSRPSSGWADGTETAKLTVSGAVVGDLVGGSVGISGDGATVAVGAAYTDIGSNADQGAVYVFTRPGGGWVTTNQQTAKLVASDGGEYDYLGNTLAVSSDGSTVVGGATYASTTLPFSSEGAVYVFVKPSGGWVNGTQTAKLTASDQLQNAYLGSSVAVSADGSTVVAGAPGATIGSHGAQGAAYVFDRPSGGWATSVTETSKLTVAGGATNDNLGTAAGMSADGQTIAVGAYPVSGLRGASYVFTGSVPANTAPPSVSGSPVVGQTFTASPGTWSGSPSFAYQWFSCDSAGSNCTAISGATGSTYVPVAGDAGHTIKVAVTAANSVGSGGTVSSAVTGPVVGVPVNTTAPAISGTAAVGQTLSASSGVWTGSPTSYAYQWSDCDSGGASCVPTPGATGATYAVAASDVGHTLQVQVTATNVAGTGVPASSAVSSVVPVVPSPSAAPSPSPAPSPLPLTLTQVSAKPNCLDVGSDPKIAYTLNRAATVSFDLEYRASSGLRTPKSCDLVPRLPGTNQIVTYSNVAANTLPGSAGANYATVTQSGAIAPASARSATARSKARRLVRSVRATRGRHTISLLRTLRATKDLVPGRYRVVMQATATDGAVSQYATVYLWTLKPKERR